MLLAWRNDPLTREASVNADLVAWESHVDWLSALLENPGRTLLVAQTDRPVGAVRIDRGDEVEMSWTVAPDARGQGHGRAMVAAAAPEGPAVAYIKRTNGASQRIASAAGFVLARDGELQRWERP